MSNLEKILTWRKLVLADEFSLELKLKHHELWKLIMLAMTWSNFKQVQTRTVHVNKTADWNCCNCRL